MCWMSNANCHLPFDKCAVGAADLHPLKDLRVESRNEALSSGGRGRGQGDQVGQVSRQLLSGTDFMSPSLLSPHI